MKKEIVTRGIIGCLGGITICYLIPIVSSLLYGDGNFYPVVPTLIETFGNEINAVIIQFLMGGVVGSCFGLGSLIWENDNWSILKQTILHLLMSSVVMFPAAYFMQWMEHSIRGIAIYVGIFMGIYVMIWFSSYMIWWGRIRRLNREIEKKM